MMNTDIRSFATPQPSMGLSWSVLVGVGSKGEVSLFWGSDHSAHRLSATCCWFVSDSLLIADASFIGPALEKSFPS
jgi:hypothetical protein